MSVGLKPPRVFCLIQSLSHVHLFGTPWTAACQASLSFTISWSLLKLMSFELMPSNHLIFCRPFCLQSFPASGSFLMSQLFASGAQSIGASMSASVLPMNSQRWFPLGLTGLISLLSKGLLQHHSSKASILQHSAFLWSSSHIQMWPLEKSQFSLYGPLSAK